MPAKQTVVRKCSKTSKPALHAQLMSGWARAIATYGKGSWADALELSGPGLDKQLSGSMPDFTTIMDAFDHDDTILDDVLTAKGKRIVSKEAVCDVDDMSLIVTRLLLWLQEATHPNSPGGRKIVHDELLPAEFMIRQLHQATGNWLGRISEIRKVGA